MKILQIVPVADDRPTLKQLLNQTERRLRRRPTAFSRKRDGRWAHVRYPGWIKWDLAMGGILMAAVTSRQPEQEWQLLQAFIGYLDRHLGEYIQTITITYR